MPEQPAVADAERFRRLFFALWPDDALRSTLAPRLAELQPGGRGAGRPQSPAQWHVTLEFLGPVPAARLSAAEGAAASVRAAPFELVLDTVEHWRRPEVLCLTARIAPAPLVSLVTQLRGALAERGFEPERRAYRAHLTLARKVTHAVDVPVFQPIHWPALDFALVESVTDRAGSRYTPLERWRLEG